MYRVKEITISEVFKYNKITITVEVGEEEDIMEVMKSLRRKLFTVLRETLLTEKAEKLYQNLKLRKELNMGEMQELYKEYGETIWELVRADKLIFDFRDLKWKVR